MLLGVPSLLSFDGFVVCCVMVVVRCAVLSVGCWWYLCLCLYVACCVVCVDLGWRVMVAVWCSLWCFGVCGVLFVCCSFVLMLFASCMVVVRYVV